MRQYFLYIGLLLLTVSCQKEYEYELSKSIFIEDPYAPGLPIYSEWGYNTFGAYIDRIPFRSDDNVFPAKIYVNHDTVHFLLQGVESYNSVSLKFSFKGFSPLNEFELIQLNNVTINLKDSTSKVVLYRNGITSLLPIIEGELVFKKASKLYIDNQLHKSILCGTFRLKTIINNEPISIYNGRFDVSIGYENFFRF